MTKLIKRRSFIETSAKVIGGAGLLAASTSCATELTTGLGKNFVHHVFFWLRQPVTAEGRARFEKGLKSLATIETIVDFHIGLPAGTSRDVIDSSYTYSMLTLNKSKEDQDIYQTHPTHLKFIADCQDLWEKVVVYDTISI